MTKKEHIVTSGEVGDNEYVRKTADEIRQIAFGVVRGDIFASWMLEEHETRMLTSVFMPLMMLNDIQMRGLKRDKIVHFYAYMKDAAPRSINGLPMFFAFSTLNAEDSSRVGKAIDAMRGAIDNCEVE